MTVLRNFQLGLLAVGCLTAAAHATTYSTMAPAEQYRMAKPDEMALARSAAPASISGKADVMVMGAKGYEIAVKGSNGFTCLVMRSWTTGFDDPGFWNPKIRGPICFNPAAVRSVLPGVLEQTRWALAGQSKDYMQKRAKTSAAANAVPEAGAFGFMMSKQAYIIDGGDHTVHPHMMFYMAHAKAADWGAGLPGSPVNAAPGDPITLFFVSTSKWSDGTPVMAMHH